MIVLLKPPALRENSRVDSTRPEYGRKGNAPCEEGGCVLSSLQDSAVAGRANALSWSSAMILPSFHTRLDAAYQTALAALLAERTLEGHWVGELSTSALSTATAVGALSLVRKHAPSADDHDPLIAGGLAWLAAHQNAEDGGWGDTVKSLSNIS